MRMNNKDLSTLVVITVVSIVMGIGFGRLIKIEPQTMVNKIMTELEIVEEDSLYVIYYDGEAYEYYR